MINHSLWSTSRHAGRDIFSMLGHCDTSPMYLMSCAGSPVQWSDRDTHCHSTYLQRSPILSPIPDAISGPSSRRSFPCIPIAACQICSFLTAHCGTRGSSRHCFLRVWRLDSKLEASYSLASEEAHHRCSSQQGSSESSHRNQNSRK